MKPPVTLDQVAALKAALFVTGIFALTFFFG